MISNIFSATNTIVNKLVYTAGLRKESNLYLIVEGKTEGLIGGNVGSGNGSGNGFWGQSGNSGFGSGILPQTGESAATYFVLAGVVIIAIAFLCLKKRRKTSG